MSTNSICHYRYNINCVNEEIQVMVLHHYHHYDQKILQSALLLHNYYVQRVNRLS
ncbi:unnamed protein product [Schistosoma margrebowiei]|uniref:Uncharacterized protein n=1 Tax=Schistosoma margrebowiei TaxID=48269 RepID=A0A3P8EW85_9TREM|nr:unnamed protein product [Schistosoma margrebowiei]